MKVKALFDPESGSRLELDRPQRPPMSNSRFRAICGLVAAALAVTLVLGVAALCGLPGLIVTALAGVAVASFVCIGF